MANHQNGAACLLTFLQMGGQVVQLAETRPKDADDLVRTFGDLVQAVLVKDAVAIHATSAALAILVDDLLKT